MLDIVLNYVSWLTIVLGGLALWLVYYFVNAINHERRIRNLGGHAAKRPTWTPYGKPPPVTLPLSSTLLTRVGADFVWEGIQYAKRDDNLAFWDDNFKKWGNPSNPYTFEANGGGRRLIFTADSENIKAILATQFNDYGKGKKFNEDWHDFLGNGIFSTDHQQWHDSRQLIRPLFIKDRVSDLKVFERHVSALKQHLGGQGQFVDVKDLFFRYTLDAASDFLLGRSVGSLQNPETSFATSFSEVLRIQSLIARAGSLNFLIPRRAFRTHIANLNSFVAPFIDEALSLSPAELEKRTNSDGYTFLHALASYTRSRSMLRDQLVAILLAGRDTTACTLSWLFYELSRHPSVVAELRREIEEVVGLDRAPTYDDLKGMRYLQHTLNETLRLYPVVPFNVRVALRDTTLPRGGGLDGNSPVGIPKDTPIIYSTHYLHLIDSNYPPVSATFPDPLLFAPNRWNAWQPRLWTYIPFNGGPRICIGQQFALTEMGYTVVRLLQRFSRVEGRMGLEVGEQAGCEKQGFEMGIGGVQENLVQRAGRRGMKMQSEIVLQPHSAVEVAFY